MTIQILNPSPRNDESEICEIELDQGAFFSNTKSHQIHCDKSDANCIIVKRGSITSELWLKSQILNWDEL